jgi:hypothetical protein
MDANVSEPIRGEVLHIGDREVALYRHGGTMWVAVFEDGACAIVEAAKWCRVGYAAIAKARREGTLRPAEPISDELAETIACLHFIYVDERAAA